ncbi:MULTISPECIES: potassium channel family protein [Streptomyces]|uniref:potassium channel family protein n=1 Tax=Streptomyces TaxID=1883 RepID=UPI0034347F8A
MIAVVFIPLYEYLAWRIWVTVQFLLIALIIPLSAASLIAANRVAPRRPRLAAWLAMTLAVVAGGFAAEYRVIENINSGQFSNLHSGLDALYFSVTVMATVGFGDVHPQGSLAKLIVTTQMLVDLVGVAVVLAVIAEVASASRRQRAEASEGNESDGDPPEDEHDWPPILDT